MKLTKKEQIEHKARELFMKHGFKKVTIDEICKKANVSRKTFYTFYENKTALVLFIFNEVMDQSFSIYEEIVGSDFTFSEKMEKMFAFKFEAVKNISMEFITDLYNPEAAELLEVFNKSLGRSMQMLRDLFQKAQETGEMNPELSLDYVMWLLQKLVELSAAPNLTTIFSSAESFTRQVSQSFIYGIMPVKSPGQ